MTQPNELTTEFLGIISKIKTLNTELKVQLQESEEVEDFDLSLMESLSEKQEAAVAELLQPKFEPIHAEHLSKLSSLLVECKEIETNLADVLAE